MDDPRALDKLSAHMKSIFHRGDPRATRATMRAMHDDLSLACKYCKWEPITEFEITVAMRTWSRKKATGSEQISFEALRAMTQDPHWSKRILQMVNDCFYKASFPEELLTGATILLPKVAIPSEWGQTRSITLSSAVLKWCSQVLLLRGQIYLAPCNRLQFSAPGKQGIEMVLLLKKLARVAQEWSEPLYIVKIDIAKAFLTRCYRKD